MRLVCPNCEAKYEVPEDAIPETGRDVQCANCGHAWYQMRPRAVVTEPAPVTAPVAAPPVAERKPEPEPAPEPTPVPAPEVTPVASAPADPAPELGEAVAAVGDAVEKVTGDTLDAVADTSPVTEAAASDVADQTVAETVAVAETPVAESEPVAADAVAVATGVSERADETADVTVEAAPAAATAAPAAYAVDDSVLAILREEAEREASARRAEAAKPLEVQADLGIEAAVPAASKPVDAVAASPVAPIAEDTDDRLSARRTRLPDVEEINSTLRPGEQSAEAVEDMPVPVEGRSSFRKGFLMVMTFAILGAALYVSSGTLSNAVPALAGFLEAYVGFIDSLRLQLDGLMQSATVAINGV